MRFWTSVFLAVVAFGAGAQLAQPPQGTTPGTSRGTTPGTTPAAIAGRAVDADSGQPLSGVLIALGGGPAPPPRVNNDAPLEPQRPPRIITGGDGQFVFRALAKGSYTVTATKPGYLPGGFGVMRPEGSPQSFSLEDGQTRADVIVRMYRYATIAGAVLDDTGEPLVGVSVRAMRRVLLGGVRALSLGGSSATTDDRGIYRLSNLVPGEYIITVSAVQTTAWATSTAANPAGAPGTYFSSDRRFVLQGTTGPLAALPDGGGRLRAYTTTYFPASRTVAQATPIALKAGEERLGVDLTLSQLPTANVGGQVVSANGQVESYALRLAPVDAGGGAPEIEIAVATSGPDGSFMFVGVPAGRYMLLTTKLGRVAAPGVDLTVAPSGTPPSFEPTMWAAVPVSVGDTDIRDLVVQVRPGPTFSGRIEYEGSPPQNTGATIALTVESADGLRPVSGITMAPLQGQFATRGFPPGRYIVTATMPGGFALKSAMANGVDIADTPIELGDRDISGIVVTFTDRRSSVEGTVRGPQGDADATAAVLVFPSDAKYWQDYGNTPRRLKSVRTTPTGAFGPVAVPPGDYCVIAIAEDAAYEWQDPRTLEALARQASRVTIGDGQKAAVQLTRSKTTAPAYGAYEAYLAITSHHVQIRDTRTATPSGSGTVSGLVLSNDESNRPIPRARVTLRPIEGRQDYATATDAAGRFGFPDVPPGRYTLMVSKPAYLTAYYGTGQGVLPPGLPIAVVAGSPVKDITLRMVRGGVIAGAVIDEAGAPVSGVRLQVLQPFGSGEDRRLGNVVIQGAPFTDHRGRYRIYGLQPGSYIVGIQPATGPADAIRQGTSTSRTVSYTPVYYPGTDAAAQAAPVRVVAGQDTDGVDIPMFLVPTTRIEGTVMMGDGRPLPSGFQFQLVSTSQLMMPTSQMTGGSTSTDRTTARFLAPSVPPGHYVLLARGVDRAIPAKPGDANPVFWAQQEIDVRGDEALAVQLVLQPALSISGRVVFDGTTTDALYDAKNVKIMMTGVGVSAVTAGQPPAAIDADGRFTIQNVIPGQYRLAASALSLPGMAAGGIWSLTSAMSGGRDLLDYPLEVRPGQSVTDVVFRYTSQTAELSGRFLDAAGKPIVESWILLFTAERALWSAGSRRVRAPARPADDGTFRFLNVPPGEYLLGVVTDLDPREAADVAFLDRLAPAAIRVTIAPGEKKVQDIRIAGLPPPSGPGARSATRQAPAR